MSETGTLAVQETEREATFSVTRCDRDPNMYFAGELGMEALLDRVLVIEDEFRSGYECMHCHEKGTLKCDQCEGTGKHRAIEHAKCSECNGAGKLQCPQCKGKGMLLEIPDAAKRRPTSGQIVSLGSEVKNVSMGDFVVFPNFCGEVYDLSGIDSGGVEQTVVLRIIKEREIICRITGHLKLRRVSHKSEVTG
jgi:co-chaperonin GroES (HSP10)